MKQRIALIGFGTVGQGLCEILLQKKNELKKNYGYEYDVVAVTDMKFGTVYNPKGLNLAKLLKDVKEKGKFTRDLKDWDAVQMVKRSNAKVVCELTYTDLKTAEPALTHCKTAFNNKKHVVTSNKGPAALAYRKMEKLAEKNGVRFLIEGTVVSGTPILNLTRGPLAGSTISAVRGILNGTTNYILTKMEEGMSYEAALTKAQELGYAEADPTGDVEGYDARAKVAILTNVVMGENFAITEVSCEGITQITSTDIAKAKENQARWKLIGSVEKKNGKVTASVKPEMVPLTHPLAGIMGAANALTFTTDMLGDVTIVGPGAGRIETGYSILTDLISIHLKK